MAIGSARRFPLLNVSGILHMPQHMGDKIALRLHGGGILASNALDRPFKDAAFVELGFGKAVRS